MRRLLPKRLRALARSMRHAPDRLMHPIRRHRATFHVRRRDRVRSVLIICHGNVCRSPFAARLIDKLVHDAGIFTPLTESAGFVGPNRSSPPEAFASAADLGVDLTDHRSQLATHENVFAADLVLVMNTRQKRSICKQFGRCTADVIILGDFDPHAIDTRSVPDPWAHSREAFDASYTRIDRCARYFVDVTDFGERAGSHARHRPRDHENVASAQHVETDAVEKTTARNSARG